MNSIILIILAIIINGRVLSVRPTLPEREYYAVTTQGNLIMAHSYSGGQEFYKLAPGDSVTIITPEARHIFSVTNITPIPRRGYYFYEREISGPLYLATCLADNGGRGDVRGLLLIALQPGAIVDNGVR